MTRLRNPLLSPHIQPWTLDPTHLDIYSLYLWWLLDLYFCCSVNFLQQWWHSSFIVLVSYCTTYSMRIFASIFASTMMSESRCLYPRRCQWWECQEMMPLCFCAILEDSLSLCFLLFLHFPMSHVTLQWFALTSTVGSTDHRLMRIRGFCFVYTPVTKIALGIYKDNPSSLAPQLTFPSNSYHST